MGYVSSSKETKEIAITIYNDGFGVVKEKRYIDIDENENTVQFQDVAQMIETDSLLVEGLDVEEFNYDYDLVSKDKLLQKYLDRTVYVYNKDEKTKTECRLLSTMGGMVLENTETKEILINPEGQLVLPELPGGLIVKPALIWKVRPSETSEVKVSYLTKGVSWTANYVVELKEKTLNLSGWVDISNKSGATFENAKMKLIAGDVKRKEMIMVDKERSLMHMDYMLSPDFEEKAFCDYHMYTLQHPTTLKDNQDKQISFINCDQIAYDRYYEYDDECYDEKVKIIIDFDNTNENGLGIPLPKGSIKVYQGDSDDGSLEFVGEDFIDHTPKEEKIKLHIGDAFDIRCIGKQVENRKSNGYLYCRYQYTIKNHKDEQIKLKFQHYIGGSWKMVNSTDEYEKIDSNKIEFTVNVQPNNEKIVDFKYRIDNRIHVTVGK